MEKGIEEIRRHITVQDALKQCDYGFGEISSSHFICFLHESFYRNAPSEELEKVSPTGEIFYIQAGKYRTTKLCGAQFQYKNKSPKTSSVTET